MRLFTTIYALLLAYIIAALSFWWISLEKQSHIIYDQELHALQQRMDASTTPAAYASEREVIEAARKGRSNQFMGEGSTFMAIMLIGAVIVYTTYRFSIRLSRQQHNFMLSVTHELKSPIAAMKLTLETIRKHQLPPEKQQQLLDRCISESDRLNELCNNILIASQMEGGQYNSPMNSWTCRPCFIPVYWYTSSVTPDVLQLQLSRRSWSRVMPYCCLWP